MQIIDENGRLFGVVNVVDALVVLLVVAVFAAGVTLVTGGLDSSDEAEPQPVRYATLSYVAPLDSDVATLQTGQTLSAVNGDETFAVTDVYYSFTPNGSAHVVTKVQYRGPFRANGDRLYGGQSTQLITGSYRLSADVLSVNQSRKTIATRQVPVVLTANVTSPVARMVEEGQEATLGGQTVATIESVRTKSTAGNRRLLWIGVELRVLDRTPGPSFDGEILRIDNRVTIVTDTAIVRGRLHELGTTNTDNLDN